MLPYSAQQIYVLVNDVARYPEFLPWCGAARVLESSDQEMLASVTIVKAGLSKEFTTRNKLLEGEQILMTLVDGPFSYLRGEWSFKKLDESACKIQFEVEFEISNGLLNMALGPIFEHIASTFVESFCKRAEQVYGK